MIDLHGRFFLGQVVANNDPEKKGRCRVQVFNIFDSLPKQQVPWATPWRDVNGNTFNVPEVGKIVSVMFENGNIYKPEYIYAEHMHKNLEDKLADLDGEDYTSMKSLIFDHKTQIYVNDSEGLNIEYKYNGINIDDSSININIKDTEGNLNLGDANAPQQAILGNHFFDWMDKFVSTLETTSFIGNMGAPVVIHPALVKIFSEYRVLRSSSDSPGFLSSHVRIVDNQAVTTQPNKSESFPVHRQNYGISGDMFKLNGILNLLFRKLPNIPFPKKRRKKKFDKKYKPPRPKGALKPSTPGANESTPPIPDVNDPTSEPTNNQYTQQTPLAPNSSYSSNPRIEYNEPDEEIEKLIDYMESKKGKSPVSDRQEYYEIFTEPFVLNIVAFRNRFHEFGTVTNRFDDELWVFFKKTDGEWEPIRKYTVTTMPGWSLENGVKTDPPTLPDDAAFINYGQYLNSYKLGYHMPEMYGNRHPCLVADKVGIRVNRRKGKIVTDRYVNTVLLSQEGPDIDGWLYETGMNIHLAMSTEKSVYGDDKYPRTGVVYDEVNNWSSGCIVFNNPNQYREFLGLINEQIDKARKTQFTLTVASYKEYELFDSIDDIDSEEANDLSLPDRFPDFTNDLDIFI